MLALLASFASVALASTTSTAPRESLSAVLARGEDVHASSLVGPIDGVTVPSYAGFFEVNATAHANHFFWYWPALNGNTSAPLLVWMQGGPGASSLFGLFAEHGPYRLNASLYPIKNEFSWANQYNVVYLDNPRQTGYSYSDAGTLCHDWTCYGADFDAFIRQFVAAYSLGANEVYVTGESYGGHYVPASAYTVMENNAAGVTPHVNLAGVAIGNGFVAPYEMVQGYADIIYNAGLLSPQEYLVAQSYVKNITSALDNDDFVGAYLIWDAFLNGDSTQGGSWFENVTGLSNYFNVASETPPDFGYYSTFVTSPAVRTALGVGNMTYNDGNLAVEIALEADVLYSQKPRVEALLQNGLKVLIYNGALDLICGAPLTERYVPLLDWQGNTAWNASPKVHWMDSMGNVAGYARSYANLVNVVIRGAGHMAPYDQPLRALDLITRFVNGTAFDA